MPGFKVLTESPNPRIPESQYARAQSLVNSR